MRVNRYRSSSMEIQQGVPQGSAFGHLLFLLYITDLPVDIHDENLVMFADDINVLISDSDETSLQTKVSNRCLSNRHNTNIFMMDTTFIKPAEKEEINNNYMTSDYTTTIGRCPMVWLPALHSSSSPPSSELWCISLQSCNAGQRWLVWFEILITVLLTMRIILDVMICHLVCRSWHFQGTTLIQKFKQYPPSQTAPHPRGTASFNMNWFNATCDAYVV